MTKPPEHGDAPSKRPERVINGLRSFLRGYALLKLGAVFTFLLVFPPICLYRGLLFASLLLGGIGVFSDYFIAGERAGVPLGRHQRTIFFALLAFHLAIVGESLTRLARPVSGGWTRLPGSEKWSEVVGMIKCGDRAMMMRGGGDESRTVVLSSNSEGGDLDDLGYPGGFGWSLAYDRANDELLAAPRNGAALYRYSISGKKWRRQSRPAGYTEHASVLDGRVFLAAEDRLYEGDREGRVWREIPDAGRCRDVAASPDPAHPIVVATGRRVVESPDGGETWRDITPSPNPFMYADVAVGAGGYRYVYSGGMFSSDFYVGEPGQALVERRLPDPDTRVLVASPIDGREIWIGTWGGGVYRSTDAGRTFTAMGLDRIEIRSLLVDFEAHTVFAPASNLAFMRGLYLKHYP